jgi:hypothetical protein
MRLACPHCGLQALSALRKLALGPARDLSCRACGLRVGTAVGPSLLAFLPCAVVVVAVPLRWISGVEAMAVAGIAAIAATCLLYLWQVPLQRRELTDRRAVAEAQARATH